MKPRNEYERNIIKMFERNGGQNSISEGLVKWATSSKVLDHFALHTSKSGWCTHCGSEIAVNGKDGKTMRCPICGETLTIKQSRAKSHSQYCYVQELTTHKGYQLCRTYAVKYYSHEGDTPLYRGCVRKVLERWYDENGRCTILKQRMGMFPNYGYDPWAYDDNMSIAREGEWTKDYRLKHYPISKVIPRLQRVLKGGDLTDINADFNIVLKGAFDGWNVWETLWKQKCYYLCYLCVEEPYMIEDYWNEIKVALRHGYKDMLEGYSMSNYGYRVHNYRTWKDLIDGLRYLGMDTHNPLHICPTDLIGYEREIARMENNRRDRQRRVAIVQSQIDSLTMEMQKNDKYVSGRARFFDFAITNDKYDVRVLKSVKEFLDEGTKMEHCVYRCAYYDLSKHPTSLILSVRNKQGGREVTIEYDLKREEIMQCFAKCDHIHKDDRYIRAMVMEYKAELRDLYKGVEKTDNKARVVA